jgi:hypothetical protein
MFLSNVFLVDYTDGCLCLYVYVCAYVCMFFCVCLCVCVYGFFCVCLYGWLFVFVCFCVYVCVYVCTRKRDEIIAKMKDVGGTRPFNNNYWSQSIKTVSNIIL